MRVVAILVFLCGCHKAPEPMDSPPSQTMTPDQAPVLITHKDQRDAAVGKLVTLVGVQTRTKNPTVLGVDVDGDYDLSNQRVRVTGILVRREVEARRLDEPIVATRGPGVYYHVVDPQTNELARPVLDR